MRKIRLSDTDLELFDIEISPPEYNFYQKHKDAFRTMWREQGTPFWTRFVITFRSFTVKHGVIKQMNIDSPKFQNLIDQAFIYIHEQFVDGTDKIAKNFIEDCARLAQHQDKLPALDSKSFAKDPFYARDTRELFRQFFGKPDQRSSYLKVYILSPVFLRFGGSVCRCLVRWVEAPNQTNPRDDSYWTKPQDGEIDRSMDAFCDESTMCDKCIDDSGTRFFKEKINGTGKGPRFLEFWTLGDPRFNDSENPLFAPHVDPEDDWREMLTIDRFRSFLQYAKFKYIPEHEQCVECKFLRQRKEKVIHVCQKNKKKKKKKKKKKNAEGDLISDKMEVGDVIDDLEGMDIITKEEYERRVKNIIGKQPKVIEALQEVENQTKGTLSDKDDKKTDKNGMKPPAYSDDNKRTTVFGKDATISDDFHYGLLKRGENSPNKSLAAGFKVIKIEDVKKGMYEANISPASVKNEEENFNKKKTSLPKQELNHFIFSADFLRETIEGLPSKFEWWEGRGFCIAVLNYEKEEKDFVKNWTNFTLKVTGYNEKPIKKIMVALLSYVAKRKRRTCHGWNMDVDDVVACILPEEHIDITDLSISIQRGFRFEDRLIQEELDSLIKHQPDFCVKRVLMGLEAGEASTLLTEKGGKDKLKNMCKAVAKYELYGNEYVTELNTMLRNAEKKGKSCDDVLWYKMLADPDQFEFFCLVDKSKEADFWKIGIKTVDVRYFLTEKNPITPICPFCKDVGFECNCKCRKAITSEAMQLVDFSKIEKVKCLDYDIPKMSYEEFNSILTEENSTPQENGKKSKTSAKKSKEKKMESSSGQKTSQDAGPTGDKSSISDQSKQNGETAGKVSVSVDGKGDRIVPIPGMTSSLNLICQDGGKEQTICVSLGAYLPESKLQQLEEKKSQQKVQKQTSSEKMTEQDRKDERKGKKDKSDKKKNVKGSTEEESKAKMKEIPENESTEKRVLNKAELDKAEIEKTVLNEAEQDKAEIEKPVLNKAKANKAIIEKTELKKDEIDKAVIEKTVMTKAEPEKADIVSDGKQEEKPGKPVNGKKKGSTKGSDEKQDVNRTDIHSSEPLDDETSLKISLLSEQMPNCSVLMVNNKMAHTEMTGMQADPVKEHPDKPEKADKQDKSMRKEEGDDKGVSLKFNLLKICYNCGEEEPSRKTFKKCQKCKEEGVQNTRYYCSRECQMEDWQKRHKAEHRNKALDA